MKRLLKKPTKAQVANFLKDMFWCFLGTAIYALSVNYFVEPMQFVPGGVTTLAIIVNHFVPVVGIGTFVFLMNMDYIRKVCCHHDIIGKNRR